MAKLGVVKNFLKFKHDMQFGVIGCGKSNISYLPNKKGELGTLCMIGFAEDVIIWNLISKEIVHRIHGRDQDNVTFLTFFSDRSNEVTISIGYESGYVAVYSQKDYSQILSIKTHKHPITNIIYTNPMGDRIICGSMDTEISVVDICDEKGYRLKGHTSVITKLQYVSEHDMLISSSKDGSIKFWQLSQMLCFKTISNGSDIWDFAFIKETNLLITASSDPMLRMWQLSFIDQSNIDLDLNQSSYDRLSNAVQATALGSVDRNSNRRSLQMVIDESQKYIAINTGEKRVEVFKIMSKAEIEKRLKKKVKKAQSLNQSPSDVTITADSRIKRSCEIPFPEKCKSLSMIFNEETSTLELLTSMKNNTVAVMELNLESFQMTVANHITSPGHRTAIVYSQFTSDRQKLFTVSLSEAKLWHLSSYECVSTIDWPRRRLLAGDDEEEVKEQLLIAQGQKLEANTAVLLTGDRHAVIGFKVGVIIMYGLINGEIVQWFNGHQESITSLIMTPDKTRLLSSSTDKCLKVWRMEYGVMNSGAKGKLHLADSGVCQQYSHGITRIAITGDNKTVLVALLNNKVQSCLLDNLGKRVLDFYHHSQPVTCIDIKYDSTEMLTGSGDKIVIKWSMQFADCRLFKGHMAPITDVKYIPGRSQAFSCDQSGVMIMIELKNMTEICRLRRHFAQITSLALFATGDEAQEKEGEEEDVVGDADLVSVSVDGSIRLWLESDEILSREVEEEEERDRRYEDEQLVRDDIIVVGAPQVTDTGLLTKKTLKTEQCADEIIEALDICRAARTEASAGAPAVPDPRMAACNYTDSDLYLLYVLNKVRSGDLEFALALLPMQYVEEFFVVANDAVRLERDVHLLTRCLWFLGRVHLATIKANERLRPLLPWIAHWTQQGIRDKYKRQMALVGEALHCLHGAVGNEYYEQREARAKAKPRSKKK